MNLPGGTSSQGRLDKAAGETGAADAAVLLVGQEGTGLRALVEKLLAEKGGGGQGVDGADSILEAVLMSGGGGREGEPAGPRVIMAGISQELEQLEPAVRSMRKVYPESRIVLLCEPGDEVLCRRAKGWGATDYLILPAEAGSVRRMLEGKPAARKAAPERSQKPEARSQKKEPPSPLGILREVVGVEANGAAEQLGSLLREEARAGRLGSAAPEGVLPGLPLMVQTVLLGDLLAGRADFAERAVATLQAYLKWGGALKFVAASADGNAGAATPPVGAQDNPQQLRALVDYPGQPAFGTLILELAPGNTGGAATAATLAQAGGWLGALLSITRRQEQLRSLAITDELSGAYNRRYFMKFMAGLLDRARENRFRVTLLMFDIDDFKKYNDEFGHSAGDAIIRELIHLLRACTRPHDLVARIGGDEFAVVYWDNEAPRQPNSEHPRDAIVATERFRKAVQTHQWSSACNIRGDLSISGGLATFPWDADSLEALMERADEALLKAKSAGKNVIFLHGAACGGEEMRDLEAEETQEGT